MPNKTRGSGLYYRNITAYKDVPSGGPGGSGSPFVSGNTSSKAISSDSTANNIIYLSSSLHYSGLYFDNPKMLSGNESIPSHDGISFTKGNRGNGCAKVTLIK